MNSKQMVYEIVDYTLAKVLPDEAVLRALSGRDFKEGRLFLLAIGKASYQMAKSAQEYLGEQIYKGIVITKYDHILSDLAPIECYEAGHPISDENGFNATKKALEMIEEVQKGDTVLFLVSGGGSALFEDSFIDLSELQKINEALLKKGASIEEINTIRKRLSKVKGGRFGELCKPAKVLSIVLSDVLSDALDIIASGPAYPDSSSVADALAIIDRYNLELSERAMTALYKETPKVLDHIETVITGSVKILCAHAKDYLEKMGYQTTIVDDGLAIEAKDAGLMIGDYALENQSSDENLAFIWGGETVVHVSGNGKGGRNQELVLAAASKIGMCKDTLLLSFGSDGTDGPTDAAGAYIDQDSYAKMEKLGLDIDAILNNNDSYHAFKKANQLIMTGPTGTNVNDLTVLLIKRV